MTGLFTKQAAVYPWRGRSTRSICSPSSRCSPRTAALPETSAPATARPPSVLQVAEHYDSVLATDVSTEQLRHAVLHPKVRYLHTPDATPGEDLVSALGGEGCVDLITVAEAMHWFDLPAFYSITNRVLRKPGGVIAVWGYN